MQTTPGGPLTGCLPGQTPSACLTIGPKLLSCENSIADLIPKVKGPARALAPALQGWQPTVKTVSHAVNAAKPASLRSMAGSR
jgi:hypothetical protein